MANALRLVFAAGLFAALGGCRGGEQASDQNVAIDINDADPSDIEAVPADETADANADLANADLGNAE